MQRFLARFRTREWPAGPLPELYHDPRSLAADLHARCVVVDRRAALVTSAHFTEAAQTRNIEVGALIRCQRFAARLADHFDQPVSASVLLPLGG